MTNGGYALWIALASLLVSVCTGLWNVISWRRTGSHLRVHALLYGDVLLVWIFNAGRSSDRVQEVVIGGRRGGIGGFRLTDELDGGFLLAPGDARRFEVNWRDVIPPESHRSLERGFESVWLLLGSMQQKRAEVLVFPQRRPPSVGWRLAPRGANLARYAPLLSAFPLGAIGSTSRDNPPAATAVGLMLLIAAFFWGMATSGYRSTRRKVERWYMVVGLFAFTISSATTRGAELLATGYPMAAYLLGALLLAIPGWIPTGLSMASAVRRQLESRRRLSAHEAEDGAQAPPAGRAPAKPAS